MEPIPDQQYITVYEWKICLEWSPAHLIDI